MTREEVVQAALVIERWCDEKQDEKGNCDCPFAIDCGNGFGACKVGRDYPSDWCLETFLRTRGMKDKHEEFKPYNCKDCVQYPCAKHDENPDYVERCDGFELW